MEERFVSDKYFDKRCHAVEYRRIMLSHTFGVANFLINAKERIMAMLKAHFDESGTDGYHAAVVIGGYVASDEQWEEFQRQWEQMLLNEDISELHMTDLISFQKEFHRDKGWDEQRRRRVLERARRVIRTNTMFGLAAAVIIADCEEFFPTKSNGKKLRHKFAKEYEICAYSCAIGIGNWARAHGIEELIKYVFEAGAKGRHQVDLTMAKAQKDDTERERYRIAGVEFKQKKNAKHPDGLVQLQAADMLAHQNCQVISNGPQGMKADVMRESLTRLIRSQDKKLYYFDRTNLPMLKSYWINE
jgi:hypothetical protein